MQALTITQRSIPATGTWSVSPARPRGQARPRHDRSVVAGLASGLAAVLLALALLPVFASAPSPVPAGGPAPMPAPAPFVN